MISIEVVEGGSSATSFPGRPSSAVTSSSNDLRSSVTTPPAVETNSPLSSIRAISLLCAAAVASTQSCWTFGDSSAFRATSGAALRSAPAAGPASGLSSGGRRSASVASTSSVVEDGGDDEVGDGDLDVGVLDQLLAGCVPGLGFEQLALVHSANTDVTPMIVARTIRMIGSVRRLVFGLRRSRRLCRPPTPFQPTSRGGLR